ncbi:MAG: hypothetical protein FK734_16920 [Asgard group archaeon]|nr:hypothetical protein [Asgard group archaeon]
MDFICAKCDAELDKNSELLLHGCPNCGSKVFKAKSNSSEDAIKRLQPTSDDKLEEYDRSYGIIPKFDEEIIVEGQEENLESDNIPTIKLKQKGVYEVNIDGLFRDKKSDPIILSGKSGIYKVELIPSNKKS